MCRSYLSVTIFRACEYNRTYWCVAYWCIAYWCVMPARQSGETSSSVTTDKIQMICHWEMIFFLCITETEVIRYAFFCADKGNCLNLEKVKVTPHRNWHLPSPRLFPLSGCVIHNHKGHDLADSGHVSTSGLKLYHICYASLIKRDLKKKVLNVIWLVWTSWKFLSPPKKENSTCLLT